MPVMKEAALCLFIQSFALSFLCTPRRFFHAQMSGRNGVRVKCQSKNGECAGETSLYGAKRSRHFLEIPGAYQFTQQISLKEYPDA